MSPGHRVNHQNLRVGLSNLDPAADPRWFIKEHGISILNVAGPRGSKEPDVYDFAKNVLTATVRQ